MSVLLKRVLTFKSNIGFGDFKDFTVQQVIDVGKEYQLVKMYYNLDRIDFRQDVKDRLFLTKEREIKKPSKDYTMTKKYGRNIVQDLINFRENRGLSNIGRAFNIANGKAIANQNASVLRREGSKAKMTLKNQGH
jgi:hypothetical protein